MKQALITTLLFLLLGGLTAQVNYTAHDFILPYDGVFRPGVNPGSTPPWTDEDLANISAGNPTMGHKGAGIKAMRPLLSEEFLEEYGYDFKLSTYQHYDNLGLKDNTIMVGFPSDEHREQAYYCPSAQSELFANMYEPIWDNGENGTPVNDDNYYALYLYNVATRYKDYVKFWEIWNEPGFDYTGALGWFPRGAPGNWWDNNPDPCDYKLRAPIFNYVRLLRISYDVIKTVDPDAYVTLSGIGYPSFLDAILRNTDNPADGSPTVDYPLGGGAYFDVLGFHSYPHFDGSVKVWSDSINGFLYSRHSDAAAEGLTKQKNIFTEVLETYGYDGTQFPLKEWIVTECNIPRKEFGDFIGSELAQRNFIMKAYVESELSNILQLHVYRLGEEGVWDEALGEFELMGLYKRLETTDLNYPIANEAAIAYKTTSDLLFGKTLDLVRTAELNLPSHIKGAAFYDETGTYTYVLWAKTLTDRSEDDTAIYSFPSTFGNGQYIQRNWDHSESQNHQTIDDQNIALNSTPIFLTEALISTSSLSGCANEIISFTALDYPGAAAWQWTLTGGTPAHSSNPQVDVLFNQPGDYEVILEAKALSGVTIATHKETITVEEAPQADYESYVSGPIARFTNKSSVNAKSFLWDFGDGNTSSEPNPQHVYSSSGNYMVSLAVHNSCGNDTFSESYEIVIPSTSQITSTANDAIAPYEGYFKPGVNLGVYPPWTDEDLADIAAGNLEKGIEGAGIKVVRPSLYEEFLEFWGYDIRLETFQHYVNLGLEDNTLIVGFPSDDHRDPSYYCPTHQSEHFANMYTDIWDNGENGTPVNDDNYYALYLYNVISRYGEFIKFYEIWNEPSFDYSSLNGWLPAGQRGNWWENDPYPCDYKLRAPIQHFVRLMRISYEVIKTQDPEALVTLSGVAFPSFLDAVLRNTDNPDDGSVNNTYPLGGGAYFDVMGFHSYPHFDGSTSYYDIDLGDWVFNRHSDAAADGLERSQDTLEQVLYDYGYNGSTFPEKHWIVTEANIPRKEFGIFIGSETAQKNYIIKTFVNSLINNFLQLHIYKIGEDATYDGAGFEFDLMGLYENLKGTPIGSQQITAEGIAYKTSSEILYGTRYDAARSAMMLLPEGISGGAFVDAKGDYTYVLWARTTEDQSEEASAQYSFPGAMNINQVLLREWDFSQSQDQENISSQNIALTATPIFLSEDTNILQPPVASFVAEDPTGCAPFDVQFNSEKSKEADSYEWTFPTGTPSSSSEANPVIIFEEPGMHTAILEVSNPAGSHTMTRNNYLIAGTLPIADFDFTVDGSFGFFTNLVENDSTEYVWDFGDGFVFPATNPSHFYFFNGIYDVMLIATNECGSDTLIRQVEIAAPVSADFTWNFITNCPPFVLLFQDQSTASPISWDWQFEGGNPTTASVMNPEVTFPGPGDYEATLIVDNGVSLDTISKTVHLESGSVNNINDLLCENESIAVNGTVYNFNNPIGTETIVGGSSMGCDSIIHVDLTFNVNDSTFLQVAICEGIELDFPPFPPITGPGTYSVTLANMFGCDSVLLLQVDQFPSPVTEVYHEICEGQSYDGMPLFADTTISETFITPYGCDSLVNNIITVWETFHTTLTDTIEGDETYTLGDSVYSETGVYFDSLQTIHGCDSIIQLNLVVRELTATNTLEEATKLHFKAFPNPFQEETLIHFRLPESSEVELAVFDIHGRKLMNLLPGQRLPSGDHVHRFGHTKLAAGVYYCRLWINGDVVSLKLVRI